MKTRHLSYGLLILLGSIGSLSMLPWSLSIEPASANPTLLKRRENINSNEVITKKPKLSTSDSSIPSIAQLGINVGGSYYQASGNKLILGNNQSRGAHPFECVEFVYGRAIELGLFQNGQGIGSVFDGDAHTWDNRVANSNYRDRLNPQVREKSIVVWEANQKFSWTEGNRSYTQTTDPVAGHVAFVEKVYPDGSFVISEGNHTPEPSVRIVKAGTPPATAAKFIYL